MSSNNTIAVSWEDLKSFISDKTTSLQALRANNGWYISAVDGNMIVQSFVPITDPRNTDQIDFEDNFQSSSNKDSSISIKGKSPSDNHSIFRTTGIEESNSSNVLLNANETFTGEWFDVEGYSNLTVTIFSDQDSAENGLRIEHSTDGVNVDDSDAFSIKAANGPEGENRQFSFQLPVKYFRITYTNGGVAQTEFRLQSKLHASRPKPSSHKISDKISGENDAELVKAVLTGKNPNQEFVNSRLDGKSNNMSTSTPLGIDGVFSSTVEDVRGYLTVDFTVFSDQTSAVDGIIIEWFADETGTTLLKTSVFSYNTAGSGSFYNIPVQGDYARISYTNSGIAQSTFLLDSRLRITPNIGLLSQVESTLSGDLLAILARAVLFGRTEEGNLNNVSLSNSNSLKVAVTDRPSEVRERTHVSIPIPDTTLAPAGTVIYTVTAGKTLYIQSFLTTQLNISATNGSWTLNDDTTVKSAFLIPARAGGSTPGAASSSSPTMPEPMQFTTNVRLVEIAGDVRVAGYLIGYEE